MSDDINPNTWIYNARMSMAVEMINASPRPPAFDEETLALTAQLYFLTVYAYACRKVAEGQFDMEKAKTFRDSLVKAVEEFVGVNMMIELVVDPLPEESEGADNWPSTIEEKP